MKTVLTHRARQAGATLMEVLIAMSISLVVTASMVAMMANSLGTTTRIVKMTKLADDMRVAMQMMTRDVRRSSYNANSVLCYANDNCATDGTPITLTGDINFVDLDGDESFDCFTFLMDRDHDGDSTTDDAGGFRRVTTGGVGVIEMWTGDSSASCNDPSGGAWVQITNPDNMDIFGFSVDDDFSYTELIRDDGAGNTLSQRVRKVRMVVEGRLVMDNDIVRRVEDVISVRNDLLTQTTGV